MFEESLQHERKSPKQINQLKENRETLRNQGQWGKIWGADEKL